MNQLQPKAKVPTEMLDTYYRLARAMAEHCSRERGTPLEHEMIEACTVLADSARKSWEQ